ncbi:uncharacterized protein O3C94_017997 [Discoglossus pictus]
MGNENSHQPENQNKTSGAPNTSEQRSSEDRQQEPPSSPTPVLVPPLDIGIPRRPKDKGGRDGRSDLITEDLSVSATNSGADVGLQRPGQDGQLPLTGLYIAGLEYKESGSSPRTGTIRASSGEDVEEDLTVSDELGLSGFLREWGREVLPEKIHVKRDERKEDLLPMPIPMTVSYDEADLEFSDALDTNDIITTNSISLEDSTKVKGTLAKDNNEIGNLTNEHMILPSQLAPEESAQLPSSSSLLAQLDGQLENIETSSAQAKGDSKDNFTAQGTLQGLWSFSESETMPADGANNQTGSQNSLIWAYSTDGSSDKNIAKLSTANKLATEGSQDRGEPSTLFLESEPNIVVSESRAGPDTFGYNLITSLANPQSVQQVAEAENLLLEQSDGGAGVSKIKTQTQSVSKT